MCAIHMMVGIVVILLLTAITIIVCNILDYEPYDEV
jgi:hypothetical protein